MTKGYCYGLRMTHCLCTACGDTLSYCLLAFLLSAIVTCAPTQDRKFDDLCLQDHHNEQNCTTHMRVIHGKYAVCSTTSIQWSEVLCGVEINNDNKAIMQCTILPILWSRLACLYAIISKRWFHWIACPFAGKWVLMWIQTNKWCSCLVKECYYYERWSSVVWLYKRRLQNVWWTQLLCACD